MSRRLLWLAPAVLALAVVAASCAGETETPNASGDVVTIEMRDSVFKPKKLTVEQGDEVTFRFVNKGAVKHDAFIGDEDAQDEHERAMREADEDEHGEHDAGGAGGITVDPGKSGTLMHRFDDDGKVLIGCHQPGHYEAGMVVKITVE